MTALLVWLKGAPESTQEIPPIILLIGLGLWALLFAIVFLFFKNRKARRANECLRRQAVKRQGTLDLDKRLMRYDYHGTEMNIGWSFGRDYSKTGGPSFVYVMFKANLCPEFFFAILNNRERGSIAERVLRPRGIDICEDLTVTSNDESLVRKLLTHDLQRDLLSYPRRLEIIFGNTHIRLGWAMGFEHGPGNFLLCLFKLSGKEADYDAVIDTTIMFYEKLNSIAINNNQVPK